MTPAPPGTNNPYSPPTPAAEAAGIVPGAASRTIRLWGLHLLTIATFLAIPVYIIGVLMLFTADIHWKWVSMLGGGLCIVSGVGGSLSGVLVLWKGAFWHRVLVVGPTLYVLTQQAGPALYLLWNVLTL